VTAHLSKQGGQAKVDSVLEFKFYSPQDVNKPENKDFFSPHINQIRKNRENWLLKNKHEVALHHKKKEGCAAMVSVVVEVVVKARSCMEPGHMVGEVFTIGWFQERAAVDNIN